MFKIQRVSARQCLYVINNIQGSLWGWIIKTLSKTEAELIIKKACKETVKHYEDQTLNELSNVKALLRKSFVFLKSHVQHIVSFSVNTE